jgi:predicted MPP superfamily phosphohydrolase
VSFPRDNRGRFAAKVISSPSVAKPRHRVRAWSSPRLNDDGAIKTVLAIGDAHDKPGRCKARFKHLGRFAGEVNPDYIVSIGDLISCDSLSAHEPPGSANDAERPGFWQELESAEEALSLFFSEHPAGSIPFYQTHGNHEHRAWSAANRQPKSQGDFPLRIEQVFARFQIETRPFGHHLTLDGVDYTHIPLNIMGKPMGGENCEQNIANKSLRSLVCGHTHRRKIIRMPKTGHGNLTVVNLGTFMPHGLIEKYSSVAQTGWSYGVYVLRVQAGEILSEKFFDIRELEEGFS